MNAVKVIVALIIAVLLSGCIVVPVGHGGRGYHGGGGYYGGGHYGDGHYRR